MKIELEISLVASLIAIRQVGFSRGKLREQSRKCVVAHGFQSFNVKVQINEFYKISNKGQYIPALVFAY